MTTTTQGQAPASTNTASGAAITQVLAYLDGLSDDAAAHIYPSDLEKCMTSECVVEVASVRAGNGYERTVPLFSREQVVAALASAQAQPVRPSCECNQGQVCGVCDPDFARVQPVAEPANGTAYAELPDEQVAFERHYRHLDLSRERDAWGNLRYTHDAVSLAWESWQVRASHGQAPAQPATAVGNSGFELHIGDSAFESWYSTYSPAHKSDKQRARDAYAAGMGDPLVVAAPTPQSVAQDAELYQFIRNCNMEDRNKLEHYSKDALDKAIRAACSSTRREVMSNDHTVERKVFEAWMENTGPRFNTVERKPDGRYWSSHTELMWVAWQARAAHTPDRQQAPAGVTGIQWQCGQQATAFGADCTYPKCQIAGGCAGVCKGVQCGPQVTGYGVQPDAEALEDAARYQWIRGTVEESTRYSRWRIEYWDGPNGWQPMQRERMDSAIDAARKQGEKE